MFALGPVSSCTCMGLHLREDVRRSGATLEKRMLEGMGLHLKEDVPYPHVENTLPKCSLIPAHGETHRPLSKQLQSASIGLINKLGI